MQFPIFLPNKRFEVKWGDVSYRVIWNESAGSATVKAVNGQAVLTPMVAFWCAWYNFHPEQTPTIWQAFFGPGLLQNFTNSQRDSYDTLNLRLGVEAEKWSVTAWGRNITDE